MTRTAKSPLLLLIIALFTFPAFASNLLADGSFETPAVPNGSTCGTFGPAQCFFPGDSIGAWQVIGKSGSQFASTMLMTNAYQETIGSTSDPLFFHVADGSQAIDLTGDGNQNTMPGINDGVKQVVDLNPGSYSLSFWVGHQESTAPGYTGGPALVDLYLGFGASSATLANEFSNGADNPSGNDVDWQQFTWNFVVPQSCGSGCMTNIAFLNNTFAGDATNPNGNNYAGLDNVVLTQTSTSPTQAPEPGSLLLLGSGLLGLAGLKRKP